MRRFLRDACFRVNISYVTFDNDIYGIIISAEPTDERGCNREITNEGR